MEIVTIKVLKKSKYAINGTKVVTYDVGEHQVEKRCADVFCQEGWAKMVDPKKAEPKKDNPGSGKKDVYTKMSAEKLVEEAKKRNLNPHSNLGKEKLVDLLCQNDLEKEGS